MKKIVIIGGGFAGLSCADIVARHRSCLGLEITLIDKSAKASFLPVLPDIISRGIKPVHVTCDIQRISKKKKINFVQSAVLSIDHDKRVVTAAAGVFAYDYLVIASGSETNFYGNEAIQKYALKLDDADDAAALRAVLLQKRYDTYFVAGGGYTGIEVATNIRKLLGKKVCIIERAPSILGPLPQWMKDFVLANLARMNIEVLTNTSIASIGEGTIGLSSGATFSNALLVWAAGVRTADFLQNLAVEKNPQGRVTVDAYLRLNEYCFVAGDAAWVADKGSFLRMSVQFAIKQGECVARNIIRSIRGKTLHPYKPLDLGYVIPMANNISCGRVFGMNVKGFLPTLLHFAMCAYRLCGVRNKIGMVRDLLGG